MPRVLRVKRIVFCSSTSLYTPSRGGLLFPFLPSVVIIASRKYSIFLRSLCLSLETSHLSSNLTYIFELDIYLLMQNLTFNLTFRINREGASTRVLDPFGSFSDLSVITIHQKSISERMSSPKKVRIFCIVQAVRGV